MKLAGSLIVVVLLLALPAAARWGNDAPPGGYPVQPWTGYAMVHGPLELDTRVPLLLDAGTSGNPGILRMAWITLSKEKDHLRGSIRMVMLSWPKAKWRVRVQLLGDGNRILRSANLVLANGGFIISVPAISEEDLRFDLGAWPAPAEAKWYRVEVEEAVEKEKPNAETSEPPGYERAPEGKCSIGVTILAADGKPAPKAEWTLWRKVDREREPIPRVLMYSRYVPWKADGVYWEPCRSVSGSPLDGVAEGTYRVEAISRSPHVDGDVTPIGRSRIFALKGPSGVATFTIPLSGSASLTVNVTDPDTGKPRKDWVLLRAPDGMPIGSSSQSFDSLTNDDGQIRYASLEPGRYTVEVSRPGWWNGPTRTVPVEITAGESKTITIPSPGTQPTRRPGTTAVP